MRRVKYISYQPVAEKKCRLFINILSPNGITGRFRKNFPEKILQVKVCTGNGVEANFLNRFLYRFNGDKTFAENGYFLRKYFGIEFHLAHTFHLHHHFPYSFQVLEGFGVCFKDFSVFAGNYIFTV